MGAEDNKDKNEAPSEGKEGGHDWMEFARSEGFDFAPPPRDPNKQQVVISGSELLGHICSRVTLGLILFIAFLAGAWVAGTALHDPDTCWLMAMGRQIFQTGALPSTDPFSYTFAPFSQALSGQKFVPYQWLSELIFYLVTVPGGLLPLLMLTATCMVTAFLSLPLSVAVRREAPFLLALIAVILGMLSASFHTLVRPQVFSFVFLSVFLQLVHSVRASSLAGEKKLFPMVLVAAPLVVLWSNMHTGFTTAFSVLLACLIGTTLALVFGKSPVRSMLVTFAVSMLGMLLASLVNPFGVGLWLYIPSLFFSATNKFIIELAPLDFAKPIYYPFLLLVAFYAVSFVVGLRLYLRLRKEAASVELTATAGLLLCELIISFLIGTIGTYNAVKTSRLIPFVALMLVAEIAALLGLANLLRGAGKLPAAATATATAATAESAEQDQKQLTPVQSENHHRGFWWNFNHHTLDLWKTGGSGELAIVCFCALAGVALIAGRVVKPELPASSVAFQAPSEQAMLVLEREKSNLQGRLFNDPQIGDVLIWRRPGQPKVFIDTRFDMYGDKLVLDYRSINECESGWKEKLGQYGIDWVMIKPQAPLARALKQLSDWTVVFEDQSALIMRKVKF
ncbi:MAG TPA: hypothetical protein PLC15_11315 [Candidatus Obscuribacter sp.]|nr:hypothetical protein [Candidatus Obscuribacter sp.]